MESPEAPKVALHVEQARRLVRFIILFLEVEFGGFFKEINGVGGHQKQTYGSHDAEYRGGRGRLRSEHEGPEHQECRKKSADGDEDEVETAE